MIRLQLATRAEVAQSSAYGAVRETCRTLSDGVGRFAKEGSSMADRTRTVATDMRAVKAAGWVSVPGFLVSPQGLVFHV